MNAPHDSRVALHRQISASVVIIEAVPNSVKGWRAVHAGAVLIELHLLIQREVVLNVRLALYVHHALERHHVQCFVGSGYQGHLPCLHHNSMGTIFFTLYISNRWEKLFVFYPYVSGVRFHS